MESLKKKSIIGFILGLAMFLSFASLGIFTSKVYAATTIDRIDIESATTSVKAGVLPKFTASTTTEHANIKASDSNNFWVRWPDGADDWEGFNSDTEAAFNDGSTRYGLRILVNLDSGYQFSNDTKIYFNAEDVTSKDFTKMRVTADGGFVYIDLGLATGDSPKAHTVTFDTDGGTSIESRTIVDGYKTYKPSDPTKKGYIFKGWYTDNTYATEFDFSNAITANTTIYAKWEPLILNEIRISSETTSVEAGALSSFTATTTTEHATIEDYGANTRWLKWKDGASNWSGFGSDYEMAVNDGKTHYGLRIKVKISDDYQFSDSAKVYFNGVDVTTVGHTTIQIFPEWGGYVIIDLGLATGDFVTVTSYEELQAAVDGCDGYNVTDSATNHVKLGADITIPASTSMGIAVINDFTLDLNGHTLAITNDNSNMVIMYGSNGINDFTSGSLTITDTSASQTGTINLGIKPIFVYQYNASNTGMHYKLTIDGGKFYGISGVSNHFFEFNSSNEYYWKNKLITFDFKITKGYFKHISTNMSSIILANDMKVNNVTFNMSFDDLTFKSGNNRLIASNESYSIDDVVPEDTNFYIFNSSEDKQVLIAERTTPATSEVPSSLWENKDGYTDTNYYGIKLVKKDGFDVTAPTFDDVNYGYSSVGAKGISIYNRGTSDLQVKSVTVDDKSKFMVTGSTEPTITSKATDYTSFTIQPVDGLDAGTHTATITVTDMADKTYTATVSFIVKPKDITSTITIEDIAAVTYSGEAQTPTLVVKDGTIELTLTTDYTVSYENNTNRGPATAKLATVEGSNYTWTGTVEKEFTINPKSITPTIEAIADQYYTGTEIKPSIVVKDGTTVLNSTTDYYVIYQNNTVAGTSAKVFALPEEGGNYIWADTPGVNSRAFTILPHTIQEAEVALARETAEYTGSAIEIAVTVTFGEITLVKDTDYTVTYTNNENVGTATVKVEGKGNYDGTINKNFEITPKTITPVIADITAVTYNGEEQKPTLTVSGNSETLVKDKDYTVSYESNINAGTATAKITAKAGSNYAWDGEVTKDFTINPMTITPTIADITAVTYKGAIHTPELTVTGNSETLKEGTHYTVAYENNTFAGTATAKITAKVGSNYTWSGTVDKEFTINAAPSTLSGNPEDVTNSINTTAKVVIGKTLDISNLVKLNPSDYPDEIGFTLDTNTIGVKLSGDGKTLDATSATGEGTVSLKASFGGWNVDGVGEKEYAATDLTFYVKVVDKEEVTISGLTDNQEITYNGNPVSLSGTITVSDDKVPVDKLERKYQGTEATVYDSTTAPTNAGTYTVTYRVADSNADYTGSVTYAFTIKKVQLAKVTLVQDTFEYTGSEIETVKNDFSGDVEDTTGTFSATNVNDYTITVSLKDKENYEWDDGNTTDLTLNWSITAKKLTKPTLSGTYTYNGNEQTATLENFNAATMNVTNNTRTEAGSQDITVSLKDTTNYAWADDSVTDLTITFEIAKATPTIEIDNLSQKEGSVTAVTYTVTPANTDGTVKVEYKVSTEEDSTYTETLPTTKGTYTVRVTVTGDSNLGDTQNTATLTITRKTTSSGGGSSAPTKYTITVKQNSNGKISPETIKVEKGNDQKFAIKANEGYEIKDVLVDGKSVGAVKEYTFENVKAAHTIEATFKKVEEVVPVEPEDGWKNPFIDVSEKDWFYEAVKFANENNLFNGVSSNEFGTQTNMTRGMIVTVLYRYAKAEASKEATFDDVEKGSYYSNAIAWAAENGIVNGVGNNNFAPDKSVTREDFVVILYRYAVKNGIDVSVGEDTNILSYEDFSEISEYAIPAFQWACGSGIITGRTSSTLAPKGTATRAEVATMVMRFVNN